MADVNFTVKKGLTVANAVTINSTAIYANTFAIITISNTSNYVYAGNSTFSGVIAFSGNTSFAGAPSFTTNTSFANVSVTGANVSFSNGFTTTGNVGIGTTSRAYTLDVVGTYSTAKANVASQTLTDAATINWDTSLGQIATVTLGGDRTMAAPTNLKVGTYILHVVQDGAGNRTITWNSVFKWPAAQAPVLSTTASRRDLFSFVCDGTNLYGSFLPDVR